MTDQKKLDELEFAAVELLRSVRALRAGSSQSVRPVKRFYRTSSPKVLRVESRLDAAQHGTRALYNRGCRCDPCTDAESVYSRERKRRARDTAGRYVWRES